MFAIPKTVDLLVKVACFVPKVFKCFTLKSNLVSRRRSTVLSLTLKS